MNFSVIDSSLTAQFDMLATVMFAILLLLIGYFIKNKVKFFVRFSIPAPVIGGLLFMVINAILYSTGTLTISFDTTLQSPFMIIFFTTVGLGASVDVVKSGGKLLFKYWFICAVIAFIQCIIGAVGAGALGLDPVYGVISGPTALVGGHGGATAYGTTIEEWGYKGGVIVGVAAATYGLIVGGLVGGPIGKRLITKFNLKPEPADNDSGSKVKNDSEKKKELTSHEVMKHLAFIMICVVVGTVLAGFISKLINMSLPTYVGAMFMAVLIRFVIDKTAIIDYNHDFVGKLGEVFLGLFLSMALMTLKLWELKGLAGPLIAVLIIQTIVLVALTYFVIFRLLGKNYNAAVMCSGLLGHSLGATPTGIVNMSSICEEFGFARRAFIIVPIVGSFLIDIIYQPMVIALLNYLRV